MEKFFEKICDFIAKFIKNEKLMSFIRKVISKEMFLYLFFGVMTTLVNLVVYHFCNLIMDVLISNIIAWIFAVAFAYITNKLFVFESKSWKLNIIGKEIISFAAARLITLGIEELGLIIMIKWLHLNEVLETSLVSGEMIIKILLAVIVVVLNYIFSKLIIFKKKDENK